MNLRRLLCLASILKSFFFAAHAAAEWPCNVDEDLFAPHAPRLLSQDDPTLRTDEHADALEEPPRPVGYPHTLLFRDGGQLRGELSEINGGIIYWKRPDAKGALAIPQDDVESITLMNSPNYSPFDGETLGFTVKLTGSDWLFGDASCPDGKEISVRLGADLALRFPMEAIQWIEHNVAPFDASSYSGNELDLANWKTRMPNMSGERLRVFSMKSAKLDSKPTDVQVHFKVKAGQSEGRSLSANLHVDESGNRAARISFRGDFIKCGEQRIPLPQNSESRDGIDDYRVFIAPNAGLAYIVRNGVEIPKVNIREVEGWEEKRIWIDRIEIVGNELGQVNELTQIDIQPWDGIQVPPTQCASTIAAMFSPGREGMKNGLSPAAGSFDKLDSNAVEIDAELHPLPRGSYVLFSRPMPRQAIHAQVEISGGRGMLSAEAISFIHGTLNFRPPLCVPAAIPLASVSRINFHAIPQNMRAFRGDTVVFRDGDELRGCVVKTGDSGPLWFQDALGAVVPLERQRVEGVKINPPDEPVSSKNGTALCLFCNGDTIRAELEDSRNHALSIKSSLFGAREFPQDGLRSVLFEPEFHRIRGSPIFFESQEPLEFDQVTIVRPDGWGEFAPFPDTPFQLSYEIASRSATFGLPYVSFSRWQTKWKDFQAFRVSVDWFNRVCCFGSTHHSYPKDQRLTPKSEARVQIFVNPQTRKAYQYLNGLLIGQADLNATDLSMLTHGGFAWIDPGPYILKELTVEHWNGALPNSDELVAINLKNGDSLSGASFSIENGKLELPCQGLQFTVPLGKVAEISFNGRPAHNPSCAARIRLLDGSIIHVDRYSWENDLLHANSLAFGEFTVSRKELSEIVIDPASGETPPSGMTRRAFVRKSTGTVLLYGAGISLATLNRANATGWGGGGGIPSNPPPDKGPYSGGQVVCYNPANHYDYRFCYKSYQPPVGAYPNRPAYYPMACMGVAKSCNLMSDSTCASWWGSTTAMGSDNGTCSY